MSSSNSNSIIQSIESHSEPVHIQGAPEALASYLISKMSENNQRPIFCLAPTQDIAQKLAKDIEVFLSTMYENSFIRVLTLPTWEHSPYGAIAPSLKIKKARMNVLSALAHPSGKMIITTTLLAASQRTIPKKTFLEKSVILRKEQEVDSLSQLSHTLSQIGYRKTDLVEDSGSFTTRGDILDIFPPDQSNPFRVEFFGDTVEKIRPYNPQTQRAFQKTHETEHLKIPPASEIFFSTKTSRQLKDSIKSFCDETGVSKKVRDEIFDTLETNSIPDYSDTWAAFCYSDKACILDYIDLKKEKTNIIIFDDLGCEQNADSTLRALKQSYDEANFKYSIAVNPENIFVSPISLLSEIQKNTKLYVDQIDLNIPSDDQPNVTPEEEDESKIQTKHKIFIKNNAEIKKNPFDQISHLTEKYAIYIFANTETQLQRIKHFLDSRMLPVSTKLVPKKGEIKLAQGFLSQGFRWPAENLAIITDGEIFGKKTKRNIKTSSLSSETAFQSLSDLQTRDYVVHVNHGIGRYQGMSLLSLQGIKSEYLQIEYAKNDKLYLPVYKLDQIQKYLGTGRTVSLDRLGSQRFEKTKGKVREQVQQLAFNLVELYAQRQLQVGTPFNSNTDEFKEMESQFVFDETPDQMKAINETLSDLISGRVMDRLICGDVGFGKTEIAMRAAFLAVLSGKQVAVLVPTTILAIQHDQSFRERLSKFGVRVESISRLKKRKEQNILLEDLQKGKIDIIIGTHRILSSQIKFKDLGLIVVDEEHRFGVEHKEKLKTLKLNTHVLTLTATPIPRTLHMAMSGLRDISLMTTPPIDRLPIRTYASKYDKAVIKKAIEFELSRGGQVFFLHNRVDSILQMAEQIQELVPQAKITVAHGQMSEALLEKSILEFYQKKSNVLVCTTIIESGLDIPSANTIIMNHADRLGLAQLYQLRGRVGRSGQRAYAYLLISSSGLLTSDAKKRLEVIQRFVELGSGFQIASHDLEIRGGGNLLGPEQSGQIAAVGFDLYTELLEEAIEEVKTGKKVSKSHLKQPEIKTPFACYLNEIFIPGIQQRLSLYRRLSIVEQIDDLLEIEEEIEDRYGRLSENAQNLIWMIRLKILLNDLQIESLTAGKDRIAVTGGPQSRLEPQKLIQLAMSDSNQFKIFPNSKIVFHHTSQSMKDMVLYITENLDKVALKNVIG